MSGTFRALGILLALGACALGGRCALALARPAASASAGQHSRAHARSCLSHAPRSDARQRRSHRCRAASRRLVGKRVAPTDPTTAVASTEPAPGGSSAGEPPATSPGTFGPAPGSTPSQGEAVPPGAPPAVPHVQVTAVEYSLTLSRPSVPAGKVILEFVNRGQDEHNLNVVPGEGPPAGAFAGTASGSVKDQAMILRAGAYTMFCSLPEHEQRGMRADLVVQ